MLQELVENLDKVDVEPEDEDVEVIEYPVEISFEALFDNANCENIDDCLNLCINGEFLEALLEYISDVIESLYEEGIDAPFPTHIEISEEGIILDNWIYADVEDEDFAMMDIDDFVENYLTGLNVECNVIDASFQIS